MDNLMTYIGIGLFVLLCVILAYIASKEGPLPEPDKKTVRDDFDEEDTAGPGRNRGERQ